MGLQLQRKEVQFSVFLQVQPCNKLNRFIIIDDHAVSDSLGGSGYASNRTVGSVYNCQNCISCTQIHTYLQAAFEFFAFTGLNKIGEISDMTIPKYLYDSVGNGTWERERTTLIKRKCHEYDEEWRMITACPMKPPVMMEWIPSGIILGLRMGVKEENLVVSMAREAGIKDIYKSIIDSKNRLNAVPVTLK